VGTGVERQTRLAVEPGVWVRTDEGLRADPDALGAALGTPAVVEWTGVVTRTVDDLDLWLSALPGFCRLIVTREAIEGGFADPIYPWGSMAAITSDSISYLLQRPAGVNADGNTVIELGVAAYGPDGQQLAVRVARRVLAWQRERTPFGEVRLEIHPADGPIPESLLVIPKRDSRVLVRAL
jgi:protein-L-isoaspartate(D-aspartate) O-methyltransferase